MRKTRPPKEIERQFNFLETNKEITKKAIQIYNKAKKQELHLRRGKTVTIAAAIYTAYKIHKQPRTLHEISEASGITKKEIGKQYRHITKKLNIKIPILTPQDYVDRFATLLNLSKNAQLKAEEIIRYIKKEDTTGKKPESITAAVLYITALINEEKRTQKEISDATGISQVTIRNRYKELLNNLDLEKERNQRK